MIKTLKFNATSGLKTFFHSALATFNLSAMSNSPGGFLEADFWFHGSISREAAGELLISEGLFNCSFVF